MFELACTRFRAPSEVIGYRWLLVSLPIVLEPTSLMTSIWITMRPMNDTSFGVPLIFAIERNDISFSEGRKPGCKINVVGNKQGLAGMEFQNKALMTTPLVIIRQYLDNGAVSLKLNTASAFMERSGQSRITLIRKTRRIAWTVDLPPANIDGNKEDNYRY